MNTILDKIVAEKRLEVERLKKEIPLKVLEDEVANQGPVKSRFADRLKRQENINCIAEIKRRSPSKGLLRETFDPVSIAGISKFELCSHKRFN